MKTKHALSIIILVGVATLGFIFNRNGLLNIQTDTVVYVDQIRYANHEIAITPDIEKRSFKPLYGILGSYLTPLFTEHQAILVINIFFYFGIIILSYFFLRELGFKEKSAIIGTTWIATGYPLLKFGLVLLTDISGWFFTLATITTFLIGLRKQSTFLIVFSSILGFLGSLCKETGVLGLFFAGVYMLSMFVYTKKKEYLKHILTISIPFIVLQALFLYSLFHGNGTGISFINWYFYNKETFESTYHTFFYFFFTEASTFNLLWVYCLYLVYALLRKKTSITKENYILGGSLLLATLPVLIWPMFLTRVLYIGYVAIVPFALIGFVVWSLENKEKIKTFYFLSLLPVLSSVSLFILASGGSLFDLLK